MLYLYYNWNDSPLSFSRNNATTNNKETACVRYVAKL